MYDILRYVHNRLLNQIVNFEDSLAAIREILVRRAGSAYTTYRLIREHLSEGTVQTGPFYSNLNQPTEDHLATLIAFESFIGLQSDIRPWSDALDVCIVELDTIIRDN